jgi:hypothetical protein
MGEPQPPVVRPPALTARSRDASVTTTRAEDSSDQTVSEDKIVAVFDFWRHECRYLRRVTLTAPRRDAIAFRLRDGYTVDQLREAIRNAAYSITAYDERISDLPHVLHCDRLPAAIADEIDDAWNSSPFGDEAY